MTKEYYISSSCCISHPDGVLLNQPEGLVNALWFTIGDGI